MRMRKIHEKYKKNSFLDLPQTLLIIWPDYIRQIVRTFDINYICGWALKWLKIFNVMLILPEWLIMIFNKLNLVQMRYVPANSNGTLLLLGLVLWADIVWSSPLSKSYWGGLPPWNDFTGKKINEKYRIHFKWHMSIKKGWNNWAKIGILEWHSRKLPDIRNTDINLISSLRKFNCELTIADCVAKKEDVEKLGISLIGMNKSKIASYLLLLTMNINL